MGSLAGFAAGLVGLVAGFAARLVGLLAGFLWNRGIPCVISCGIYCRTWVTFCEEIWALRVVEQQAPPTPMDMLDVLVLDVSVTLL